MTQTKAATGERTKEQEQIMRLNQRLAALERSLEDLKQRLTLSDEEQRILAGRADGCIRIGDLDPILHRIFGKAA